jgi:glycosyltransferase involved in cell wall biosynthesis
LKILVVISYYPPHFVGGHELGCRDMVDALRARGHDVQVLTSCPRGQKPGRSGHVWRTLWADGHRPKRSNPWLDKLGAVFWLLAREAANQRAFQDVTRRFRPDVVQFWSVNGISLSMALRASRAAKRGGTPVSFMVGDIWLQEWESVDVWWRMWRRLAPLSRRVSWLRTLSRRVLKMPAPDETLDTRHVVFVSQYLKDTALKLGKKVAAARVIPWGVRATDFPFAPRQLLGEKARLLCAGQIVPLKDPLTAVEALAILHRLGHSGVTLTLAGGSVTPDYRQQVLQRVCDLKLEESVDFRGQVARDEMRDLYQCHDIFIFPSHYKEGFGLVALEAMMSGCLVVSTAQGGAAEVTRDGETGLTFAPGDASAAAAAVEGLLFDNARAEHLRTRSLEVARSEFSFDKMVEAIEEDLLEITGLP